MEYSKETIDGWLETSVMPYVKGKKWSELSIKKQADENRSYLHKACKIYGKHKFDWKSVLVNKLGLKEEEYSFVIASSKGIPKEKVDEWLYANIAPLIEGKNWRELSLKNYKNNPEIKKACSIYGKHKFDWKSVLVNKLGLKEEDYQNITHAGHCEYQDREIDNWLSETIFPLIKKRSLLELAAINYLDDSRFNVACTRYGKHKFDWKSVLVKCGLKKQDYRQIKTLSRTRGFGKRSKEVYAQNKNKVDPWLESHIVPLIKEKNLSMLTSNQWSNYPIFHAACHVYGKGSNDWKSVLKHCGLEERDYSKMISSIYSEANRKFSQKDIDQWIEKDIVSLISSKKWDKLSLKQWRKAPLFLSACKKYGKHHMDWEGLLSHCGVGEEDYKNHIKQKPGRREK